MKHWELFSIETKGAVPDKIWVTDGEEQALFKPDSEKRESEIEYAVYRLATALGIPCARIELVKIFGAAGCLSYNFKKTDPNIIYCPADGLYMTSNDVTYKSKNSAGSPLNRISKLSFEIIRERINSVEFGVIDMLFLDCLVSNRDRHGNNWELIMNLKGEVIDIAPLFDHGMSLWNSFSPELDYCMVPWGEKQVELKHFEMFERLSQEYPERIFQLLSKAQKADMNDFVIERYNRMINIYNTLHGAHEELNEQIEVKYINPIVEI